MLCGDYLPGCLDLIMQASEGIAHRVHRLIHFFHRVVGSAKVRDKRVTHRNDDVGRRPVQRFPSSKTQADQHHKQQHNGQTVVLRPSAQRITNLVNLCQYRHAVSHAALSIDQKLIDDFLANRSSFVGALRAAHPAALETDPFCFYNRG